MRCYGSPSSGSGCLEIRRCGGDTQRSLLVQGLAREQWKRAFPSNKQAHGRFVASLEEGIANLRGAFPGRIAFGQVSGAAATSQNIQVWGANADNWNLALGSSIHGAGQAAAMGVQGPGVFGIVTTPVCGSPS